MTAAEDERRPVARSDRDRLIIVDRIVYECSAFPSFTRGRLAVFSRNFSQRDHAVGDFDRISMFDERGPALDFGSRKRDSEMDRIREFAAAGRAGRVSIGPEPGMTVDRRFLHRIEELIEAGGMVEVGVAQDDGVERRRNVKEPGVVDDARRLAGVEQDVADGCREAPLTAQPLWNRLRDRIVRENRYLDHGPRPVRYRFRFPSRCVRSTCRSRDELPSRESRHHILREYVGMIQHGFPSDIRTRASDEFGIQSSAA